jgi:transcriptional regulator with XRE-family HTH domain
MSIFGERLRSLRDKRGQKQIDVGKLVGKSRETICKYEIGDREPDINTLNALAEQFGVTTDYILGRTEYTDENSNLKHSPEKYKYPHLKEFDIYLRDINFIKYLRLAANIKDYDLDFETIDKMIKNMAKFKDKLSLENNKKHPQK